MILQNGNLLDDGKQYRHRYILNIPTFQYHVHFMLASMYKLPQQLAVAQFFTSLPPTPLHPLPLFCVGFGYYTLFYLTAYFLNFHLSYIHVFLCWNLICPVGVCVSIIIETMKVGDTPST